MEVKERNRFPTVMTRLKDQLTKLMNGIGETHSRYICCIKPNTQKRKLIMENISTVNQLRGAALVSASFMSRSTYSHKLFHSEVVERYRMLNKGNGKIVFPDVKSECEDFLLWHNQSGFKTRAILVRHFWSASESERSKCFAEVDDAILLDSWVYCTFTDYV